MPQKWAGPTAQACGKSRQWSAGCGGKHSHLPERAVPTGVRGESAAAVESSGELGAAWQGKVATGNLVESRDLLCTLVRSSKAPGDEREKNARDKLEKNRTYIILRNILMDQLKGQALKRWEGWTRRLVAKISGGEANELPKGSVG